MDTKIATFLYSMSYGLVTERWKS